MSIQSTSTIFALLHSLHLLSPFPLIPSSRKNLFYLSVLHFLSGYRLFKGGSSWYFTHVYIALYSDKLPLLLLPYHPAPLLCNSLQCISFYYLHTHIQCILILFTLYHSPSPLQSPYSPLGQTHYCNYILSLFSLNYLSLFLHIYREICMYKFMYTFIFILHE
jgi:hypothetical protein